MKRKYWLISEILLLAIIVILICYIAKTSERESGVQTKVICQKIEYFTQHYFRFLEDITIDCGQEGITLSVSYIPETGSGPVKEEIYQEAAYHALQITSFFPEVKQMEYVVLWDDTAKREAMTLTLDESKIKQLENTFYNDRMEQSNGLETSFQNVFSSISETDESRPWREGIHIDPDSTVP